MRDSYLPLRRAGSIRPRPVRGGDRWLVLAVAGAILLLQGASLDRLDEMAQAEPLAVGRSRDAGTPDGLDRPRGLPAATTASTFLASPREVISCAQPPVGTFESGDAGCMRATLSDAPVEEPASVAAAVPAAAQPEVAAAQPPGRAMLPPFVATMPSLQPASDAEAVSEPKSPVVTAAIAEPVAPRPATALRESPTRDAVVPARAAVRLKALDEVLVGRWVPRTEVCSKRGRAEECLPLTVGRTSARAGSASCRFTDMVREGGRWKTTASCRNESDRWTAHVRLSLAGKRLSWTSERGTQDYTR